MRLPRYSRRDRTRSLGQSLAEFALVTPILLLVFAGAADFGRAYYAYVAIENAAKEGALFGSRVPICDDAASGTCADPNNVVWRVRGELKQQGLRNPDGTELTPVIACLAPNGTPRVDLTTCAEGDTYQVAVVYPFKLLTPVLGNVIGDLNLRAVSRAVVLNFAFDPSPGASVQKLVSPTGATNASAIVAKCLEPDDFDSAGFYRSPCLDSSTPDPIDKLSLNFEEGTPITYKLTVGNSGVQTLTGVTVSDSRGATGCTFPTTLVVGQVAPPCTYVRTPTVTAITENYANVATIDSAQTLPATDGVTVVINKPPARLNVLKWVSPFKDGNDGDGVPNFGTNRTVSVTYSAQVPGPSVWFKVIVRNTGGQTATGVVISDSRGALPFGQTNANAVCPAAPSTLAANAIWECRYRVVLSSTSPPTTNNTASATATNVTPDSDDSTTATVQISQCTGTSRTVPNLIGLDKGATSAAWTSAGFTGALTTWSGQPNAVTVAQSRPAFECVAATSAMTAFKDVTP